MKDKRGWSKIMLLGESAADIGNLSPIFSLEVPNVQTDKLLTENGYTE